jgi:hypothetical protein
MAGIYTARHLDDARALFMFRSKRELDYHHRDTVRQKELLRDAFAGMDAQVDRWLAEVDRTPAFYFDSISQLQLDTWSRGRVTLVGDAGYCPGPAVGGSTSLAVLGAYVLAGELTQARGDHVRAFAAYEHEMAETVRRSRAFARGAAKSVIPGSTAAVWAVIRGAQLVSLLPAPLTRTLAKLNTKGVRLYDSIGSRTTRRCRFNQRRPRNTVRSWLLDTYCSGSSTRSDSLRGTVIRSRRRCATSSREPTRCRPDRSSTSDAVPEILRCIWPTTGGRSPALISRRRRSIKRAPRPVAHALRSISSTPTSPTCVRPESVDRSS